VLRPELSAILGAERFLAEIKTTANLQHPNILSLFDSGEAEGTVFYVMPYVEGESLRDRLVREKQLPVEDAVSIAREVASALDYAHRHGVVHRDIKPENILLHDGRALVADFGIALAVSRSDGGTRMTETGMSLGTPFYMSPEQAMGEREITAKSDVYALGCVTYEMLVGEPPFMGPTAQAIIARVMTEAPRSLQLQRHTIPPHVEAAVRRALEKLPADRFQSAAEFATALGDPTYASRITIASGIPAVGPGASRTRAFLAAAVAVAALSLALAAWALLRPTPPRQVIRYSMGIPPGQAMRQGVLGVNIAFSPDGKRLVYVGPGEGGDQLWVRDRDRLDATPLPGTIGAASPYFSPDGDRIAYSSGLNIQLKVVPVTGGPPIALAAPGTGAGGGGAWGPDGWIYFDSPRGLSRIQADGGTPELLITYDSATRELGHAWPDALPNGKGLLYRSRRNLDVADFDLVALDLATRQRHTLTKGLLARYVAPGYLVFLRSDGAVLAAPFDQDQLKLTGPAVPLFEGVMIKPFGSADLAISPTGTLAYVPGLASTGGGTAELVFVTREGAVAPLNPPTSFNPSGNLSLSLSPDGNRVALDVLGTASPDIWVKQLPAGPLSRLTFDSVGAVRPRWTPDGRSVLYLSAANTGRGAVWKRRADGSAPAEPVWQVPGRSVAEATLSRDGQWLIYRINADSSRDIYALRLGRDTTPIPLLTGRFNEQGAALSPDGRWLAYSSDESGRDEIYVRPFPNTAAGRWQISTAGGFAALWAHSGRELFYGAPSGDFMAVPVASGSTFNPGVPQRLFPLGSGLIPSSIVPYYDLTPDDRRFVMVRLAAVNQAPGAGQIVMVDNWFEELGRKMRPARK
jgi:serine/threonine-protein kinase